MAIVTGKRSGQRKKALFKKGKFLVEKPLKKKEGKAESIPPRPPET